MEKVKIEIQRLANLYLGQKEKKGNSGFFDPIFEEEMKAIGWLKGYPWCMSFVRLVYLKAIRKVCPENVGLEGFVRLALKHSVLGTYNELKKVNPYFAITHETIPGGIVLWKTSVTNGHAGLALPNASLKTIKSIDGNTNKAGSREGEIVAEKTRSITGNGKWQYLGCASLRGDNA